MVDGYLLVHRWPSDDYACTWFPDESWDIPTMQKFWATDSLMVGWDPLPTHLSPPDTPQLDINWFDPMSPVLDDDTGDVAFRKVLSLTGEWLPLAGEAHGRSVYHSMAAVSVRKDDCLSPSRSTTVWALDEVSIVADRVMWVAGLGHVWFEGDGADGLRSVVATHELSGIGFVKCWDETNEFAFNKKWYWYNDSGEFWADWQPQ